MTVVKVKALAAKAEKSLPLKSVAQPMTEECKGYARVAVRIKVARAVWALWEKLRAEEGLDQNWLVERLDSNKGRVSKLLNSPGNWTLDTVADLLEAMEARLTLVEVKRYREIDAISVIEPSMTGLREHSRFWNVVVQDVEGDKHVEAEMLELRVSRSVEPKPSTPLHIESSERA